MTGKFIVFEGGEGSGKTTQVKLLTEYLQSKGIEFIFTREPGGLNCPIAEKIREVLLDNNHKEMTNRTELLLYAASRAQHTEQIIWPAMKEGKLVLCDRYFGSSFAYQHFGRGVASLDEIRQLTKWAIGDFVPDLVLYLDIDPEVGIKRRGTDLNRWDNEKLELHQKIRSGYLQLVKSEPHWQLVDASRSIDEIQDELRKIVDEFLDLK
jgi:dTMP kinase